MMVLSPGVEPGASTFGGWRSIQLSYESLFKLAVHTGIEPVFRQ